MRILEIHFQTCIFYSGWCGKETKINMGQKHSNLKEMKCHLAQQTQCNWWTFILSVGQYKWVGPNYWTGWLNLNLTKWLNWTRCLNNRRVYRKKTRRLNRNWEKIIACSDKETLQNPGGAGGSTGCHFEIHLAHWYWWSSLDSRLYCSFCRRCYQMITQL